VQHGDHRHRAVLDGVEAGVPGARVLHAFGHVAFGDLGEVQPGAEVLALATEHGRADAGGQVDPDRVQLRQQFVADAVALGGAVQAHVQHGAGTLQPQQVQCGQRAAGGQGSKLVLIGWLSSGSDHARVGRRGVQASTSAARRSAPGAG
jgi:hypothetical protein